MDLANGRMGRVRRTPPLRILAHRIGRAEDALETAFLPRRPRPAGRAQGSSSWISPVCRAPWRGRDLRNLSSVDVEHAPVVFSEYTEQPAELDARMAWAITARGTRGRGLVLQAAGGTRGHDVDAEDSERNNEARALTSGSDAVDGPRHRHRDVPICGAARYADCPGMAISGQSEPSFGMSEKRRFAEVTACTANDEAKAIWTTANPVAEWRMGDKILK